MKNFQKQCSAFLISALLVLAAGCASTQNRESTGEFIDDSVITTRVKAAVLRESSLRSSEINVETFKGVVQLSGFVNSQEDINTAVALTSAIEGVASVSNDMIVK